MSRQIYTKVLLIIISLLALMSCAADDSVDYVEYENTEDIEAQADGEEDLVEQNIQSMEVKIHAFQFSE